MSTPSSGSQVSWTNHCASQAKLWAVTLGYYIDPYLPALTTIQGSSKPPPEMNIGNHIRSTLIFDEMIPFDQIVNIGAGFDTSYFRLKDLSDGKIRRCIEFDLKKVVSQKAQLINASPSLFKTGLIRDVHNDFYMGDQGNYCLSACDLNNVEDLIEMIKKWKDAGKRILIVAECVLCYLPKDTIDRLLSALASQLPNASMFIYDQVNMNDSFGVQMIRSLAERGVAIPGAAHSINELKQRFLNCGWKHVEAKMMFDVYNGHKWIVPLLDRCPLDGIDILEQLYSHYCFVRATNH
ncbi:hypothetical protein ACOME3_002139 [Neoechinorhynchus agilis]